MTTARTTGASTDVAAPMQELFTAGERTALVGFLAGYSGLTRDAYAPDLRMFTSWCEQHEVHLFQAKRADIECAPHREGNRPGHRRTARRSHLSPT